MKKGGYQIIDFNDTAIMSKATLPTAVTIKGVFAALSNPFRKMAVASRLNLDGKKMSDFPLTIISASDEQIRCVLYSNFFADGGTSYLMNISSEDAVSVYKITITYGVDNAQ